MKISTMSLCLMIVLFFPIKVIAQTDYSLKGKLENGDKQPVPMANVIILKTADAQFVKRTVTDSMGFFLIKPIKAKKILVKISAIGYKTRVDTLELHTQNTDMGRIRLEKEVLAIGEVIVKAKQPILKREANKFILNLEGNNLMKGKDILRVINRIPGVKVDTKGDISLLSGKSLTVMVNNRVEDLGGEGLSAFLSSLNAEDVKQIELITNPSAKYDAEGTGGILNIVMRRTHGKGWNASLNSSLSKGRKWSEKGGVNLSFSNKKLYFFGLLNLSDKRILLNSETIRNEKDYAVSSYSKDFFKQNSKPLLRGEWTYDINDKNELHLLLGLLDFTQDDTSYGRSEKSTLGSTPTQDYLENNTGYDLLKKNVGFNYRYKIDSLGSKWDINASYIRYDSQQDAKINFDNNKENSALSSDENSDLISLSTDYTKKIKSLEIGLGAKYTDSNMRLLNDYKQIPGFVSLKDFISKAQQEYSERITAGYINLKGKWNRFSYQGGVRFEHTDLKADASRTIDSWFPSFSLSYESPSKNHSLGLSYSRRISRPDFQDLNPFIYIATRYDYSQGNPNLLPEFNNSFELSYTYHDNLIFSFYYEQGSDITANIYKTVSNALINFPINVGKSFEYGVSLSKNFYVGNWWESYNDLIISYNKQDMSYNSDSKKVNSWIAEIDSFQSFHIADQWDMGMDFTYAPKNTVMGVYRLVKPIWQIDCSLNKSFFHKALDINLNLSDILNTWKTQYKVLFPKDNILYSSNDDRRKITLTLKYHFLKGKKVNKKEFKDNSEGKRLKY